MDLTFGSQGIERRFHYGEQMRGVSAVYYSSGVNSQIGQINCGHERELAGFTSCESTVKQVHLAS